MLNPVQNIFNLFFPEVCLICNNVLLKKKQVICISCQSNLTLTHFSSWKGNAIEKTFYGRVPIQAATSLLYFSRKGLVQKLMHQLKYRNQQIIGHFIGEWLADEMVLSERFEELDGIIPVPLHKHKFKKRGYNQLTKFGESLANKLHIPFLENILICTSESKTQTFKNRLERSVSGKEKFELTDKFILNNKKVLLIDDIITTGATLEACCVSLLQTENIKISIATMSYTV